jgi:putative oxidoreductase
MKPDLHNKWMEAELGTFEEGSSPAPQQRPKSSIAGSIWDFAYAAARIIIALLFALHGAQRLVGIFEGQAHDNQVVAIGLLEFIGGVALALGVYTRPVSLVLCCEMAWVYYQLCIPNGVWPMPKNGEFSMFYFFFFLLLSLIGPGVISFDRQGGRRA